MYFANTYGVLEYDGVTWRHSEACDRAWVRSIALDAADNLYVGCQNDFGVLIPADGGKLHYQSLASKLPASMRTGA